MPNQFDDDARLFGQDLIDATRRWNAPVVDQRVQRLEGDLRSTQTQLARQQVMSALDRDPQLGGTWRQTNDSPAFMAWLEQTDPLSGEPRLGLMRRAFDAGSASRVRAFFAAFAASQLPQRQRTAERLPMERGAPAIKPAALSDTVVGRQRMFSRPEIARFYADCARGAYDGREAERLRIEHEILAAARESRVANPPVRMPNDPR